MYGWLGQPVAQARSMALHESQSLSFEMQMGSHPGFVALLAPRVREAFGDQPAFEAGNLHRNELSGALHGLLRVRMFAQDDAHLFVMPEQIEDEVLITSDGIEPFAALHLDVHLIDIDPHYLRHLLGHRR